MKPDALILCTLATTILSSCCHVVAAFVSSQSASSAAQSAATAKNAGLMAYPGGIPGSYMNHAATGSISFQPHDSVIEQEEQQQEEANERSAVYDPGDELLRTLNAELTATGQELGTLPEEPDYADTVFNELEVASQYDMLRKLQNDLREEQEVVSKTALLMKLLEDPSIDTLPVVYVEETPIEESNNLLYPSTTKTGMSKRSRYYRRYPWKRHNRNRSSYEPELRYACTPTKEDVFKLLVNLHENRKGNHSKTVNFCNRKRPAKAIFTNIRFLG